MLMLPLTPVSVSLLVPVPSWLPVWLPWLLLVPWSSSLPVPLSLLLSSCRSEHRWRRLRREEVAGKDMIEQAQAGGATSWPLRTSTHSVFLREMGQQISKLDG